MTPDGCIRRTSGGTTPSFIRETRPCIPPIATPNALFSRSAHRISPSPKPEHASDRKQKVLRLDRGERPTSSSLPSSSISRENVDGEKPILPDQFPKVSRGGRETEKRKLESQPRSVRRARQGFASGPLSGCRANSCTKRWNALFDN